MNKNDQDYPVQGSQQAADVARAKLHALYGANQDQQQSTPTQPQTQAVPQTPHQSVQAQSPQPPTHQPNVPQQTPQSPNTNQANAFVIPNNNQRVIQPPPPSPQSDIQELYAREQVLQQEAEHLKQQPAAPDHQLKSDSQNAFALPSTAHAANHQLQSPAPQSAPAPQPTSPQPQTNTTPNAFHIPSQTPPQPPVQPNIQALSSQAGHQPPQQPISRAQQVQNHKDQPKKESKTPTGNSWSDKLKQKWHHFIHGDDIVPGHGKAIRNALIVSIFIVLFYNNQLIMGQVQYYISPGDQVVSPTIIEAQGTNQASEQNRIVIPKINVDVPVVYDITSWADADVQRGLERGVVHYGTTALPGEVGNNVIVGHSSNSVWNGGKYKFAFVLLDQLDNGDTFILDYDGTRYIYEVFNKEVIEPTDVEVLDQETGGEPITTLITCTPPGTAWRRLIVQARQISPNPLEASQQRETKIETENYIPGDTGESLLDSLRGLFN